MASTESAFRSLEAPGWRPAGSWFFVWSEWALAVFAVGTQCFRADTALHFPSQEELGRTISQLIHAFQTTEAREYSPEARPVPANPRVTTDVAVCSQTSSYREVAVWKLVVWNATECSACTQQTNGAQE